MKHQIGVALSAVSLMCMVALGLPPAASASVDTIDSRAMSVGIADNPNDAIEPTSDDTTELTSDNTTEVESAIITETESHDTPDTASDNIIKSGINPATPTIELAPDGTAELTSDDTTEVESDVITETESHDTPDTASDNITESGTSPTTPTIEPTSDDTTELTSDNTTEVESDVITETESHDTPDTASDNITESDISPATLTSIIISPVNPSVMSGQTEQFTAQGFDQDGNILTDVTFTWSIARYQSDAGSIDSSSGIFTAGTIPGTYTDAIEANSGDITGITSTTVTPLPLTITTDLLDDGKENVNYSQTLAATGGEPPYAWSITAENLPDGLSIDGDTISGVPTTAGIYTFTANVTDSASPTPGTVTTDLSITISPAIRITDNTTETTSFIVRLVAGLGVTAQREVIERNGGVETSSVPVLRMHFIKVPNDSVDDVVPLYQSDPDVESIEQDKIRKGGETSSDPSYLEQWALPRIGWDSVFGSATPAGSSVIAILDTGIDASHPDLSGLVRSGYTTFEGSDAQTDPNGHGTKMAGITAALTNNGIGIAGVAYAGTSLLPVQVLGADGTGQDSDIISGIVWAVEHGANVILMAFSNPDYSPALQEAIDYAWDNGVVLVAAAGNDGLDTVTYPAGDRGVMGISATDPDDALASSSNYGQITFMAAPGENLLTTGPNGSYTAVSGTSAAAMVAGAAAFMHAVDPSLSNGIIVDRLARTADPVGTREQTGNGRLNMARALSDTSTDTVQPAGASPLGDGGPYVGPYVAAAARTASVSGNWSSTTTWGGSSVPTSSDTVTINAGITVTVDTTAACSTLTFAAVTSSSLVTIYGNNSLAVTGLITMPRPSTGATCSIAVGAGSLTAGSLTMSATTSGRNDIISISTGTVTISGTVTTSGAGCQFNFTGAGLLTFGGTTTWTGTPTLTPSTGTVKYSLAGAQTVIPTTHNNLTLSGSGAKTTTSVTVNGILSMEGTATVSAAPTYGSAAALQYNTATARTAGSEWITPFVATGGVVIKNTGTITLNAAKQFGNSTNVTLNINPGATLSTSGSNYGLTFHGDFVNGGTLTAGSSAVTIAGTTATQNIGGFTTTGTVSLTKTGGTATFTGNVNGGALTINGSGGTLNLGTGLTHTFTGTWTRTNGTLDGGSSTLNLGLSISGTGSTFTAGTGTVNYNRAGVQTCAVVTYNNLTLSGSGVKTFATTPTVNGILSMEGTATITVTTGVVTYGASATLQYNTATARTAGSEWITPFVATGGVVIKNNGTITLNAAKQFGNSTNVTLNINPGVTLSTSGSNYGLTFHGDFVNGGTLTAGSSAVTIAGTTATQNIGGFTTTGTVSLTKTGGTATFTGNINGNGLTINGNGGILNLGTGLTHTFTGTWTRTNGTLDGGSSTLKIGGSVSGTGGTFTASTGMVEWNAAGAQTVAAVTYNNLTLSGSGAKTMTSVTAVSANLTVSGSATMTDNAGFTVTGALNYGSSGSSTLTASTPISIGTFNQTAGTLVDNGNTITVTGTGASTWTKSGGTFTATGTITFTGAAPQIGASNFNHLTINVGNGNAATLTGDVTISGTLTLTSGTFTLGANTLTLNGPTIAGTPSNLATTSSSSLSFGGSSAGVNIPSSVTALNSLTTNNSNGITLNSSPTISGTLTFTSGNLLAGSNTVIIAAGGTVSRTSGYVIGNLQKNIATGATSRTFEVGTASAYNPVTVVFGNVTTAGNLVVKVTSGQHPNIGTSTVSSTKNVNEYWSFTNSGIVFNNYSATFTFVSGDIIGGADNNNFVIGEYSGSWTYPTVGTKTSTSTQATGITSFGDFGVGEPKVLTVNSVTLSDTSMTPQMQYTVTVNVSNIDGKADLNMLVLKLWYDSSGNDYSESTFNSKTSDTQNCAIITWTQSTDSFAIQPSSSTTWALGTCSSPGSLPGDFTFRFTVGKVATETSGSARWQVAAKASNDVGQTSFNYDSTPSNMDWYGEISVNTVNITWPDTIALGSGFTNDTTNRVTDISLKYISNGNYSIKAKATSAWTYNEQSITLATDDTPGDGEFAMKADDDTTLSGAVLIVPTGYTTLGTGTQTGESGNTVTNNSLWLKLGASDIPAVQYSGTIYYSIEP